MGIAITPATDAQNAAARQTKTPRKCQVTNYIFHCPICGKPALWPAMVRANADGTRILTLAEADNTPDTTLVAVGENCRKKLGRAYY